MSFRGYISKRAWARAQWRGFWRFVRGLPRNLRRIIRHWWWLALGQREHTIEERDRYKAWGEQQYRRATAAEMAVHMLKVEHRGASVDVLRAVADEIDCEPGCDRASTDYSTNVTECPLSDRGECPFDKACQLRELADALETKAEVA
jgi:hypothetical protein